MNADYCLCAVERCGLIIKTLSDIECTISSATSATQIGQYVLQYQQLRSCNKFCNISNSDHSLFTILSAIRDLMQTVRDISREWDKLLDTIEGSSSIRAYHATSSRGGCVGRLRFQVSREQLVYLRSLNFRTLRAFVSCVQNVLYAADEGPRAKTSCTQLLINSATYLLTINSPIHEFS